MASADETHDLGAGLYFWQVHEPAVKTELSCAAIRSGTLWYFIDPIPLAAGALQELIGDGVRAGAILLTNGNHQRAAAAFRDRFALPVVAHSDAAAEFTIPVDRLVVEGDQLCDEITVIALPGAAAGEVAYLHAGSGTMCVGDALIHLYSHGFAPLPAKYCRDSRALRPALARLLDYRFERMTFAHGMPIVAKARTRLESLLASLS